MRDPYRTPKLPTPTPPGPYDLWDIDPTPAVPHPRPTRRRIPEAWTGPREEDHEHGRPEVLRHPVPGSRWPYGPPHMHQQGCHLHTGGVYCDCAASDAGDEEWGMG